MRLFHFSEDPNIEAFQPRAVAVPAQRRSGFDWLNGPLVWAIDDWHQPLYFFPRNCPRILIWSVGTTTRDDWNAWFLGSDARMIAFVEEKWQASHASAVIHRYELPTAGFESLDDAGMWVSRAPT